MKPNAGCGQIPKGQTCEPNFAASKLIVGPQSLSEGISLMNGNSFPWQEHFSLSFGKNSVLPGHGGHLLGPFVSSCNLVLGPRCVHHGEEVSLVGCPTTPLPGKWLTIGASFLSLS